MSFEIKILRPQDVESILIFERASLQRQGLDQADSQFNEWSSRWRQEALDHYLPKGWSFAAWGEGGELKGYFLGQPLLFFQGLTQNLWVEHLAYLSEEVAEALVEVAYRWSRDKHLQRVVFADGEDYKFAFANWSPNSLDLKMIELKTAKY